jgi:plastin-1
LKFHRNLINFSKPDTIDPRCLNKKENLNIWEKYENLQLVINSCKGIGCHMINIQPSIFIQESPHLILGLIWQIIKIQCWENISIHKYPQIFKDSQVIMKKEEILSKWMNYYLEKSGSSRRLTNISKDLFDCECYILVLGQLLPEFDIAILKEKDQLKRCEMMMSAYESLTSTKRIVDPRHIVNGDVKLNFLFLSMLFKNSSKENIIPKSLTREENTIICWIQSLGFEIHHLIEIENDLKILLLIIDKVRPFLENYQQFDFENKEWVNQLVLEIVISELKFPKNVVDAGITSILSHLMNTQFHSDFDECDQFKEQNLVQRV